MNNMTVPQLLMMLNPGAANTTYMQPDQEAMLRNQSISPYTPQGNVQMPNMQPFNIKGLLGALAGAGGALAGAGVGAGVGVGPRVQGAMEGANVGARGLDTPAEREFLMESLLRQKNAPNLTQRELNSITDTELLDLISRGVPSQREMDTLMQMLQTGR